MPTIFEQDGYRVVVHTSRQHGPPHVHVIHGDAVIVISIDGGVARFREGSAKRRKPPEREIRRAEEIMSARLGDCIAAWNRYHGDPAS